MSLNETRHLVDSSALSVAGGSADFMEVITNREYLEE